MTDTTPSASLIYGTFLLAGTEFAIGMDSLQEVIDAPDRYERMPLAPVWLRGLHPLRGRVLPVIDLHTLLGMAPEGAGEQPPRMAILKHGPARLGLLFDRLGEVLRAAPGELRRFSAGRDRAALPVSGILSRDGGRRLIQVLDLEALLAIRNLTDLAQASGAEEEHSRLRSRVQDLLREKLVVFSINGCRLALDRRAVAQIVEARNLRATPRPSPLCAEMLLNQGHFIPVIRTSVMLGLGDPVPAEGESDSGDAAPATGRIIISRAGEEYFGFAVDDVTDLIPYSAERIAPIPILSDDRGDLIRGCVPDLNGRPLMVLNEEALLGRPELASITLRFHHDTAELEAEQAAARQGGGSRLSMMAFRLGQLFAMPLTEVLEVIDASTPLVRTPCAPPAVLGTIDLRGLPVPVVDPKRLFSLEAASGAVEPRILIFQDSTFQDSTRRDGARPNEIRKIGMRVDAVESILTVDAAGEGDHMPDLFFHQDRTRFGEAFDRGLAIPAAQGGKQPVIVLRSTQVVARLSEALSAA